MARAYRKPSKKVRPKSSGFVDRADELADWVHLELPVSLAEIIDGVSDDIERLSGEAGLLIMQAVMKDEVDAIVDPKGKHHPDREATRWTKQRGYVVLAVQPPARLPRASPGEVESVSRSAAHSQTLAPAARGQCLPVPRRPP